MKKIEDTRYLEYSEGQSEFIKDVINANSNTLDHLPVVHRLYYLKSYLGVLLTSIEVLGLPERQEKSFKDVVKMNFWKFVEDGFIVPKDIDYHLSPKLNELVDEENIMTEEEARKSGIDVDKIYEETKGEMLNI